MQFSNTLSTTATDFPNFNSTTTSCVIFCESGKKLLFVETNESSQAGRWGLPGGNLGVNEAPLEAAKRIFKEQTNVEVSEKNLSLHGQRFARLYAGDCTIHFIELHLDQKPAALAAHQWISIFALNILDIVTNRVIDGRQEAFEVVYGNRTWQRMTPEASSTNSTLTFVKGNQRLSFDKNRKLIIPFVGTSHAGKETHATLLNHKFGLANISDRNIYRAEEYDSSLTAMIKAFGEKHQKKATPIEVTIGMLIKRISNDDCFPGYMIRHFPETQAQCRIFLRTFVSSQDILLPIFLDIPDSIAETRFEHVDANNKTRMINFNMRRNGLFQELTAAAPLSTVSQSADDSVLDVFHEIALIVENKFDALAEQERSLATRRIELVKGNETTQHDDNGNSTTLLLGCTAVIGVIFTVGFFLGKNNNYL